MICQACKKNPATVRVIDIQNVEHDGQPARSVRESRVCDACADQMGVPHAPILKGNVNIWKLLHQSIQRSRQEDETACPHCGMTVAEFKRKGRLGCPHDYEIFGDQLEGLLQRMHNATQHVGRLPGVAEGEVQRIQQLSELRARLEEAVREEQYESAARLRDEIKGLEDA